MKITTSLAGLLILLCGCAVNSGDFCDVSKPLRPTADAVAAMSDREKADILKHNEFGAEKCGWKP